jgi:hypothetical protein
MHYTVVTDSHYRTFLKEEGYGFVAEFHTTPEGLQVRPCNKGVDMPLAELTQLVVEVSA